MLRQALFHNSVDHVRTSAQYVRKPAFACDAYNPTIAHYCTGALKLAPGPSLLVFLAAALALNVSPGPDMLYVISRSLGQGRKPGIVSALGVGAGTLVHTIVAS